MNKWKITIFYISMKQLINNETTNARVNSRVINDEQMYRIYANLIGPNMAPPIHIGSLVCEASTHLKRTSIE